ncbi:SDR family NAD(P)-dependent oxidoreductase [Catellatospora citrea]|uniref:Short-chain dehydrogenase n=1 Tax=Catellatospora citrea TaxID=53366 RepID=A0A8J3KRT9_9ACTN|nr:SDR family NAD(P)-dependent oxidoreductase [Catellatospora citrea]RKE12313.1 NAD(P)-dependent dehydrogenase (short-subunit alcohol dehydrogenase family) [Catellatospora citrea]GIG00820.1 short-chain dehydrogenase [Catellatospora citrea]
MTQDQPRIVVVTGANRGIGRELVRQLYVRGDTAVLGSRDLIKGRDAADEITATAGSGQVVALRMDVTDPSALRAAAGELGERLGRVDVLVNNAAILYDTWQKPATADLDVVRSALETNLFGAWQTTQALLPLLTSGRSPRIVNVSSESGSLTSMGDATPAYSISKAALNALTRQLAAELATDGILVNSVCPGWIATDMGGPGGGPIADGAASVLWAADLPDDGPTGGFFRHGKPLPW